MSRSWEYGTEHPAYQSSVAGLPVFISPPDASCESGSLTDLQADEAARCICGGEVVPHDELAGRLTFDRGVQRGPVVERAAGFHRVGQVRGRGILRHGEAQVLAVAERFEIVGQRIRASR